MLVVIPHLVGERKWGHLAKHEDIETIVKKMDDMVKWYGQKKTSNPIAGDLSQCLLQDDGVHLVLTGGEPLLKGFSTKCL